jgi:hypothetical protein
MLAVLPHSLTRLSFFNQWAAVGPFIMRNPDAHPDLGKNFRLLPDAIQMKSTKFQNIPVGLSDCLLDI